MLESLSAEFSALKIKENLIRQIIDELILNKGTFYQYYTNIKNDEILSVEKNLIELGYIVEKEIHKNTYITKSFFGKKETTHKSTYYIIKLGDKNV